MPRPARPLQTVALLALTVMVSDATAQAQILVQGGRVVGPGQQNREIVAQFDADKDGRLNTEERAAARQSIGSFGGGRGGGRFGGNRPAASPGINLTSSEVQHYPNAPLYDPATLRTFFIEFENADWEAEMVAFNNTDVDVPATVTVDGRIYHDVGVHFRGNSSFGVGNGYKRSLNLAFDFVHTDQAIGGYRTLNFLNANSDPSLMRTVLSMHIARQYIAAPKTNFVRVVINGENWGVYENAQQFNKEFVKDNFGTTKGARWKIPQGGGQGGGFTYQGDDASRYNRTFQIKSKDEPEAWAALIDLASTLNMTPVESLEAALASRLDIDAYLRFLALDNIMISGDAFFQRASDYSLYRHPDGQFHFVFHDANEMLGTGRAELSPLVSQNDTAKPIISKVLAVPALRAKYLGYVREIAEKSLDWNAIGPVVKQYRDLIAADVARDTRKLFSTDDFLSTTADDPAYGTLRSFFEGRRAFLLRWLEQNTAAPAPR
jgi:CotH protein